MTRRRRVLLALIALSAGLLVRPPVASATEGRFVEQPRVSVGDSDGDGLPEASAAGVAGGPCACRCPVMGGDADAGAAGQRVAARTGTALVVCGTRATASVNPGGPDVGAGNGAGGRLRFNPGGLARATRAAEHAGASLRA